MSNLCLKSRFCSSPFLRVLLFLKQAKRDARRRELLAAALTRQPAAANAAAGLRRLASNGRCWFSAREQRGERWRWEPVRAAALRRGARGRPARPAAQLAAAVGPSGCLQAESGQQAAGPARGPSNPRGAARPRSQRQRPKVWHTHAHLWSRHLWSGVLQLSSFVHETLLFQLQCLMIG